MGRGSGVKEPACGAPMPIGVLKREFRLPSVRPGCSAVGGDSPGEKQKADYACRNPWSSFSDAGSIPAISTTDHTRLAFDDASLVVLRAAGSAGVEVEE